MRLSDKGFFLLDALLAVFILSSLCILCFSLYQMMDKYEKGYLEYQERSNRNYERILQGFNDCEVCLIDESD